MTILVTGARGHVGRAVLAGLLDTGASVRASSRDPRPGELPDGVEVVRADLTYPATLPAALSGVDKVFLYAQPSTTSADPFPPAVTVPRPGRWSRSVPR